MPKRKRAAMLSARSAGPRGYRNLMAASSHGQYVHAHIKNAYRWHQVS
ncbi:MAG TPA: KTSC domain-containing protein [Ktedonobacteraceae bacterium]|nr:KTSC domain-containing protein [Ktedonobacteraceae bacterium]